MINKYEIRGNKAVIFLERRFARTISTVIDAADLEKAKSIDGKWYPTFQNHTNYVLAKVKQGDKMKSVFLHRYLYDEIPNGLVVDHINHDTLDNRRSKNLRVVSVRENVLNTMPRSQKKVVY